MKGEQHPSAKVCVAALEKYCEKIFNAYNKLPLINEQPEEIHRLIMERRQEQRRRFGQTRFSQNQICMAAKHYSRHLFR